MLPGAVLLLLGLPLVAGTRAGAPPSPSPAASPPVLATLTRTVNGWFGGEAYEVVIATDGTVRYEGHANVGALGPRTKRLTPGQIDRLIAAFDCLSLAHIDEVLDADAEGAGAVIARLVGQDHAR